MRTNANQCEMALDAPDSAITLCRSEAHAVQICLALAQRRLGRDQKTVALLCGWKSDSCLSEAAGESNKRRIPESRRARFANATGCNLLTQYLARKESERLAAGKTTQRDRIDSVADACAIAWGIAA